MSSVMTVREFTAKSDEVAGLLGLLANGRRLHILCELLDGERSVSALEAEVGLSQSALSQHLAKLREGAIVTTRREAQTIYYSIADARVRRILDVLADIYCKPQKRARVAAKAG